MYQDSLQELYKKDYCKGIKGFINFIISYLRNISGDGIKYLCVKCKNKKSHQSNDMMMHLLKKRFLEKYLYWFTHGEPYVPYETILERIVGITSSSSNIHQIIDDNSNRYRGMVMDIMGINHGYSSESSRVDEEPNVDAARFFELQKDFNEPLWDGCTNYNYLFVIARVFTIKSN